MIELALHILEVSRNNLLSNKPILRNLNSENTNFLLTIKLGENYFILSGSVPKAAYGSHRPPEPSEVKFGVKSSDITVTFKPKAKL